MSIPAASYGVHVEGMIPAACLDLIRGDNNKYAFFWAIVIGSTNSRGFHPDGRGEVWAIVVDALEIKVGGNRKMITIRLNQAFNFADGNIAVSVISDKH